MVEGGFKSVVFLFIYDNDKDCCFGMDYLFVIFKMVMIVKEFGF